MNGVERTYPGLWKNFLPKGYGMSWIWKRVRVYLFVILLSAISFLIAPAVADFVNLKLIMIATIFIVTISLLINYLFFYGRERFLALALLAIPLLMLGLSFAHEGGAWLQSKWASLASASADPMTIGHSGVGSGASR